MAVLLFALTFAALRHAKVDRAVYSNASANRFIAPEIMVPIEIIEAGEDPAVQQIRVQP